MSGVTSAGSTEIGELDTSSGNDMGGVPWYDSVSSGGRRVRRRSRRPLPLAGRRRTYGPIAVVRVREAPISSGTLFGWWTAEDITGLGDGDDITSWPEHNPDTDLAGRNKPSTNPSHQLYLGRSSPVRQGKRSPPGRSC